ncbi:MAG: hypothetical protein RCG15_03005 [Candidatus Rickettsia vulgarisii]
MPVGIVNIEGGIITGSIGDTNAIAQLNCEGSGAIILQTQSNVKTYKISDASAVLIANGSMTGDIDYTGTVNVNNGLTGDVDFAGQTNAVFNLNATITGDVNNTGGSPAGTVNLLTNTSTITGDIGTPTKLLAIQLSGAGNQTIPASYSGANNIVITNSGVNATAADPITTNVIFIWYWYCNSKWRDDR